MSEFCRREQFVLDKSMALLYFFARMCKQNVELFGYPDLLIEYPFSRRVHVCIFLKVLHRFFKRPFVHTFPAELYFITVLIETTISFTADTNHFSATKLFLKQVRFSFIVFDVSLATSSRGKLTGCCSRVVVANFLSDSILNSFQFGFYTLLKRIMCER